MFILWLIMWFIAGFLTIGTIRYLKEKREIEKEMTEQLMLHEALKEKTLTEVNALFTTFGIDKAYKLLLNDYKIKHGYKIKD